MSISRFELLWKAFWQLGPRPLALLGWYRLGLYVGFYRRGCPASARTNRLHLEAALPGADALRAILDDAAQADLLAHADEIVAGVFRPFGGAPAPLRLSWPLPLSHWTDYERGKIRWDTASLGLQYPDIKLIWEAARFSWVFPLGRAFRLTGEMRYAAAFWQHFETFAESNPPCQGIQWMNGQEAALRLLALVWADAVFAESPASTSARRRALAESVAQHAVRVAQTLVYARAQNNNHLLSEAAALVTAAHVLPQHPRAGRWRRTGRRWVIWALTHQIDAESGEYIQHSTTYHRLVLQLALWLRWLDGLDWLTPAARKNLRAAARWLRVRTQPSSGDAPNLGSNDGANFLPLADGGYRDFRPTAQAAALAFEAQAAFPPGLWDEMSLWLGLLRPKAPAVQETDWRWYLRRTRGNLRLAHADLLHLDLWRRGVNLALDPGTFLYNGTPPWDNPWPPAYFHNTVTLDGRDQMTRGGRFLYLDWAQAWTLPAAEGRDCAETNAWRRWGWRHQRCVWRDGQSVHVEDRLTPRRGADEPHTFRLHWLLPDYPWHLDEHGEALSLSLHMPSGRLCLHITPFAGDFSLVRGGNLLAGVDDETRLRGWYAPTYALKIPALSLAVRQKAAAPLCFETQFTLHPRKG